MKLRALKFGSVVAISLLVAVSGSVPAAADYCGYYGCGPEIVVRPQPYAHHHYHNLAYGPRYSLAPIYVYHGQGGAVLGQSYWGGYAWRYIRPGF